MTTAKTRLECGVDVLITIDRQRSETGNTCVGTAIENSIIERELAELEADILADPGALEALFVPVRMRFRGQIINEPRRG